MHCFFLIDQDNAEPSANSVAVRNLRRLGVLLGSPNYTARARDVCTAFSTRLNPHPYVLPTMASECVLMAESNAQAVWCARLNQMHALLRRWCSLATPTATHTVNSCAHLMQHAPALDCSLARARLHQSSRRRFPWMRRSALIRCVTC